MRVTVVGAGYAGLVTAACFTEFGHTVVSLDTNAEMIARLRDGVIPIHEPGLDELVARSTAAGALRFESDYSVAIPEAELVMITVDTPMSRNGEADLSSVANATTNTAKLMQPGTTVVIKSTVPMGTADMMASEVASTRPDVEFEIASNPEFLRQGSAVHDFLNPDRIVVGTRTPQAAQQLRRLYRPSIEAGAEVIFTTLETAELIKYAANSFLAVKLSYINEIADVCEKAGCDINDVTRALGLDPRIGPQFLHPGPGYGGSCLPKDTRALLHATQVLGAPSRVLAAAIDANAQRATRMADRITAAAGGSVSGKQIAVLGLTFKANTNDLRESPALAIVRALVGRQAQLRAYDPEGMESARAILGGVEFAEDAYSCVREADVIVIATEWEEFATLDLDLVRSLAAEPVIVDLRNLYDAVEMTQAGFRYLPIGR